MDRIAQDKGAVGGASEIAVFGATSNLLGQKRTGTCWEEAG